MGVTAGKITKEMREQWRVAAEKKKQEQLARISVLMNEPHLDEDGYPSVAALEIIEIWDWSDTKGWFEFINSIWHLKDWGWEEGTEPHDWNKDELVYRYSISTAGWSGNESIVKAMERNDMLWHFTWVQSRRGGHYIFEDRDYA